MSIWVISYHKDNNTSTLDMPQATQPSVEEASSFLLAWVRRNLPAGDYGAAQDEHGDAPTTELLRRYGITLSGITRQ
ncbi:hypothetical protein HNP46_000997 [Pseudomonas nitritireducens]|uniref:Uncharacterized protein n=1 Tax=Pseudomonas nitroreducens TaxID=46680 RepID=A0A7W7P017_PSENT|nr:hypothetical protein [Pseudomonas nitritireducens]MBB4862159.1 hypothetical protein [Pseudomonas nitritireducens]